MIEHNPSAISTFDARGMCAYGKSLLSLRPCLDYAADADLLVVTNADVVRGVFCGHRHSNMVSEIVAETPDGTAATVPQYVVGGVYAKPYAMKITVR